MLEVLQFIFSDFWVWFGTVILVSVLGASIGGVISSVRGKGES